jgi:hypothetical protein
MDVRLGFESYIIQKKGVMVKKSIVTLNIDEILKEE